MYPMFCVYCKKKVFQKVIQIWNARLKRLTVRACDSDTQLFVEFRTIHFTSDELYHFFAVIIVHNSSL